MIVIDKKEILYQIREAKNLCNQMYFTGNQILTLESRIDEIKKTYEPKINPFSKKNLILLYLASLGSVTIPISVISVFVNIQFLYILPVLAGFAAYFYKKFYDTQKAPKFKKELEQTLKKQETELNEKIDDLYLYNEYIPELLKDFPEDLQYNVVFDFVYGAIENDCATNIIEGIELYKEQLEEKEKDETEEAKKLLKDIEKDIEKMNKRKEIMKKIVKNA